MEARTYIKQKWPTSSWYETLTNGLFFLFQDYVYIVTNICRAYKGPTLPKACLRCLASSASTIGIGTPEDKAIPLHPVTYADNKPANAYPFLSKIRSFLMSNWNMATQKKVMKKRYVNVTLYCMFISLLTVRKCYLHFKTWSLHYVYEVQTSFFEGQMCSRNFICTFFLQLDCKILYNLEKGRGVLLVLVY